MRKYLPGTLCAVLLLGASLPALAQEAPDGIAAASGLETVIVTARKRAENAQTVPISITAFDQADLDRLSVRTIEDLKYVAPSVSIAPTNFRQDTLNVTIRGQRDFDSSSGQSVMSFDTAAAVYMDGVYMARPVGLTGALFDIDHIEVLKGPQGTLVGRNATGGAILYRSREPEATYGSSLKVTGGDYGRAELQGVTNIPFSDTLFFRAALLLSNSKGYIANYYSDPATGYRNNQAAMGSNKLAANFSLKWAPDDSMSILLRANIAAEHNTGSTYHDLGIIPGSGVRNGRPAICNIPGTCTGFTDLLGHVIAPYYTNYLTGLAVNPDPAAYNAAINSFTREQQYGFWSTEQTVSNANVGHYQTVSAEVNKAFGDGLSMKWLNAYRWWDNRGTSIGRGLSYNTANYEYQVPDYKAYQSELTFNGDAMQGALQWTGGLFFFQENSPRDGGLFYLYLPSAGTPAPVTSPNRQITLQDGTRSGRRNTSYAAYAQATYTLAPGTRLTAGGRYTYDERAALLATRSVIFPATAATTATVANGVFDPAPISLNGISYAGQTRACTLTDRNGRLLPLTSCDQRRAASYHKPTWTLAIDHDVWDGTMVYATMRSGYRSGAINAAAINPDVTIARPENITDYEVGFKSDLTLLGMPARANMAAYYSAYHDIQILVALPNVTLATAPGGGPCTQANFAASACSGSITNDNVTLNARKARIQGAEWDISLKPVPALTLRASGSYLDAVYTDYTFTPPPGYLLPTTTTNLSGTPFPLPRWQANATASYATGLKDVLGMPVEDLVLTAHYAWQSRYRADLRNFDPSQRTGSYGVLNLRVELLRLAEGDFDLAAYMNNALNTPRCLPEYNGVLNSAPNSSFGIPNTAGLLQCVPLAPRQTGVTLSYRF